jgi:hypothetical protein
MTQVIDTKDLKASFTESEGVIALVFAGSAETAAMSAIDELLKKAHDTALTNGVKEISVGFRDLEFMNSSCIKVFVTWLTRIESIAEDKRYRIRFLSDPNKSWQKRSLQALSCFALGSITVDS